MTLSTYYGTTYLPGQFYDLDKQCQALLGIGSSYSSCEIPNDPVCETIYCYDPTTGSCSATIGMNT